LLCKQLDLFGGELIAIDGSKFRAVNARDRSYTAPRLKKLLHDIDATITTYLQKLDTHDRQESTVTTPSTDELRKRIATLEQRRKRLEEFQAELAATGERTLSLTDPDSRPMMSGAGIEICYNVQTAVDAKHKLIVAQTVTNAAADRDQLSPLATAAQQIMGTSGTVVVADRGYYHGAQIKACVDAGLIPLVSRPKTSANAPLGLFTKDDFKYDRTHDAYQCPAGETLTCRTTTVELGRTIKNYRGKACKHCTLKSRCTRNRDGRKLTRWVNENLLDDMDNNLHKQPELFRQRKALAEHPFGTMKRSMDQGYFLLKGLTKVRGEFSLTVLAYNLKRVINIVRVPRLLAALA
jgi:macrodomain Ter protein organizer (MatP/YcbG family)